MGAAAIGGLCQSFPRPSTAVQGSPQLVSNTAGPPDKACWYGGRSHWWPMSVLPLSSSPSSTAVQGSPQLVSNTAGPPDKACWYGGRSHWWPLSVLPPALYSSAGLSPTGLKHSWAARQGLLVWGPQPLVASVSPSPLLPLPPPLEQCRALPNWSQTQLGRQTRLVGMGAAAIGGLCQSFPSTSPSSSATAVQGSPQLVSNTAGPPDKACWYGGRSHWWPLSVLPPALYSSAGLSPTGLKHSWAARQGLLVWGPQPLVAYVSPSPLLPLPPPLEQCRALPTRGCLSFTYNGSGRPRFTS